MNENSILGRISGNITRKKIIYKLGPFQLGCESFQSKQRLWNRPKLKYA